MITALMPLDKKPLHPCSPDAPCEGLALTWNVRTVRASSVGLLGSYRVWSARHHTPLAGRAGAPWRRCGERRVRTGDWRRIILNPLVSPCKRGAEHQAAPLHAMDAITLSRLRARRGAQKSIMMFPPRNSLTFL
jgi:hypothetical protein